VFKEILYWNKAFGIKDFAFYDDALLISAETHIRVLLENISRLNLGLRFHTPNAVHAREITMELAMLMRIAGFKTMRLGLETSDFELRKGLDQKMAEGDFERAVENLRMAGFSSSEIGAYIMVGLPDQSVASVIDSIRFVAEAGALPYLSEYSPIPHTALWEQAVRHSIFDIAAEPLYQNNTLIPCWDDKRRDEMPRLKQTALEARQRYR
jgi:radical SAM superfamily enzyme YgiQ (UPF0313 family)